VRRRPGRIGAAQAVDTHLGLGWLAVGIVHPAFLTRGSRQARPEMTIDARAERLVPVGD
jgi:hypothetical protein